MADDSGELKNALDEREALLHQSVADLRTANAAIERAQAAVKVAKKAAKIVRNAAKLRGFTLAILDEALKREGQGNAREQQAHEEERAFVFKALGLPVGLLHQSGDFDFGDPEKRDERYWGDEGYRRGVQGLDADLPEGIPPHFHQVFLLRHAAGADRLAWAQAERGLNPEMKGSGGGPTAAEIARRPEPAGDEADTEGDPLLAD